MIINGTMTSIRLQKDAPNKGHTNSIGERIDGRKKKRDQGEDHLQDAEEGENGKSGGEMRKNTGPHQGDAEEADDPRKIGEGAEADVGRRDADAVEGLITISPSFSTCRS